MLRLFLWRPRSGSRGELTRSTPPLADSRATEASAERANSVNGPVSPCRLLPQDCAMSVFRLLLFALAVALPAGALSAQTAPLWTVPEVSALPHDATGTQIRAGRDLITATYAYIGPQVADPAKRYAGNNLACSNCHLQAGTRKFGLPLFGLFGAFPQYSARAAAEITIEDRLNSCMTRSMNGRVLPNDAPEMQAMVAYIKFLSTDVAAGQTLPGMGSGTMPELERAADPLRGRAIYARACLTCHNSDG